MDLTVHNTVMLIKFSKQIANSFAKITDGEMVLELIRGEFKTCQISEMGLFPRILNWL